MSPPAGIGPPARRIGLPSLSPTVRALFATALGILPLAELFSNGGWLIDAWLAIVVVLVPAALLRASRPPRVWHTWLGIALLLVWLTVRFAGGHAAAGVIPTPATWDDVNHMFDQVRDITNNGVAPVHATAAVSFVVALTCGVLAAFVDLAAVVGRRPALGGVPFLVVFTLAGAVPRHPVSWVLFACAALGFLLLLSVDSADTVRSWGRLIPKPGERRQGGSLGVSGPRIAVIAVAVAVLLPLLAPSSAKNVLTDALHDSGSSGTGVGGFGAGSGVALDPFAALKGQLDRSHTVNLFSVKLDHADADPYYLRANVLSNYTDQGWSVGSHGATDNAGSTLFVTDPPSDQLSTRTYRATISVSGLSDTPPVFANPAQIAGLPGRTGWSTADQILVNSQVSGGAKYTEEVREPAPSVSQLSAATTSDPAPDGRWLQVPADLPHQVVDQVTSLTAGISGPYAKARALNDWFTNPANGFTYSLNANSGDSGSALLDFLTNKAGYCQQYAAALGVMLRLADVPARVVLGYTHPKPNQSGTFQVTTSDAHAWVEAYFDGLGWIPFDPTPVAQQPGGSTAQLPWAPHPSASSAATATSTAGPTTTPGVTAGRSDPTGPQATQPSNSGGAAGGWFWAAGAIVLATVVAALPAFVRWLRRRSRLDAARHGDPDPLWAELTATATDLGYVWSPARSPRQIVAWLGPQLGSRPPGESAAGTSLRTLALAVEQKRYRETPESGGPLVRELREVESQLRARRGRSTRIRSRLLPTSLGWGLPWTSRRH
jgi:transglutaminase-like putative cysteine protease